MMNTEDRSRGRKRRRGGGILSRLWPMELIAYALTAASYQDQLTHSGASLGYGSCPELPHQALRY